MATNFVYFIAGVLCCFFGLAAIGLGEKMKNNPVRKKWGKITDFSFNWTADTDWQKDLTGPDLTRIIVNLVNRESWQWVYLRVAPGRYRMRTRLHVDFVEVDEHGTERTQREI